MLTSQTSASLLALSLAAFVACDPDDDDGIAACPRADSYDAPALDSFGNEAFIDTLILTEAACLEVSGYYGSGCIDDDLRVVFVRSPVLSLETIYTVRMYDAALDPCEALVRGSTTVSIDELPTDAWPVRLRWEGQNGLDGGNLDL